MATAKKGTYLIEFWNGNKYVVGNNYKAWYVHAIELGLSKWPDVSRHQMFKSVQYSSTPFVDDGGLKYCGADIYQEVIDDVAKQSGKTLKAFDQYVFENVPKELALLDRKFAKW